MADFFGFDHVDTRVPSISAVEPFYDRFMPELGLPRKHHAHVDERGDWDDPSDAKPYNAVEYFEEVAPGGVSRFIGFIEDRTMRPTLTRIAFRASSPADLDRWHSVLRSIGACNVERSASADYPAIFFEDPAGTKLEIVARHARTV
jgi:catechol 2,3-dioxygenase-like lactoylglutathione lyase family enzyme